MLVTQLCLTLCDPSVCSPSGSSVCGILQARILEWVAISFSRGSTDPGIEPGSPSLQAEFLLSETLGKSLLICIKCIFICCCCLVIKLCLTMCPCELQHAWLPCPSLSPGVCPDSYPLSWWCNPSITSSVILFSSCLQSFPASGSFPISWLFASGGKVLELLLQHQSFQRIFSVNFLADLLAVQGTVYFHKLSQIISLCGI